MISVFNEFYKTLKIFNSFSMNFSKTFIQFYSTIDTKFSESFKTKEISMFKIFSN